jgi:hypothetical protein
VQQDGRVLRQRICDAGESRASCPDDCTRGCNEDGGCEPGLGETEANCPTDCPGECVPDTCRDRCGHPEDGCGGTLDCECCFPTGCQGRCGRVDDGCGNEIDCGSCGPVCPHPDGVCEPDEGEDEANCPAECDERCGNADCEAGEHARCPSDCPEPACHTDTCAAGCPLLPTFQIRPETRAARDRALLRLPDNIEGSS